MTDDSYRAAPEVTHREVTTVVKWFNPIKGFGFVQLGSQGPDAFLHVSVLAPTGHSDLIEGSEVICDLSEGRKGLQVVSIYSVSPAEGGTSPAAHDGEPVEEVEGTVKFFNMEKGFGFVIPENGGKDVFVSARTLYHAGITNLQPNARVRMQTRMGPKGPMAEAVELI
jgi:CspA family cold shock protein